MLIPGLDPDLIALIPAPIEAFLLLFPVSENYEKARIEEESRLKGQNVSDKVVYFKQTIGNACGTIGLLHSLFNANIKLKDGSPLALLRKKTVGLDAAASAKVLETDDTLAEAHADIAVQGQTAAPDAEEHVNLHYAALVKVDGDIYELDGRKTAPINHGKVTDFVADAVKIIKGFMERDPDDVQFNLIALGPNMSD